jgi:hypothetical protein
MKKLLIALMLSFIVLCSFICSKDSEMTARQQDMNTTIDMSQFSGARTQFTITSEDGSARWHFDSDSIKIYHVMIPENATYKIEWRLMGIANPNPNHKAYIRYRNNSNINSIWENVVHTQYGWRMYGTYLFTSN